MKLTNKDLLNITGGAAISGALINAFARGLGVLLDIGRSLGTAISRLANGKACK